MVANNTILLAFLFLLALLPSYPLPAIKTFSPMILFMGLIFIKLINYRANVSLIFLLILIFSLSGVAISGLIGGGDTTAIIKEFIRAHTLFLFLILIGDFVDDIDARKVINCLWVIFIFNFLLVIFQYNEFYFTVIYTQVNAEMPFFRPAGTMGNPNLTAFFISCLLILFSFEARFSMRFFAVLLCIATGIMMQSRSGLLLIVLSALYVLSFDVGSRKIILSITLLIVSFFLISSPISGDIIQNYMGDKFSYLTSIFQANELTDISSVVLRMELWSIALKHMASVIFGGAIYETTLVVDSEYIYSYSHRGIYSLFIYSFLFSFVYLKLEPRVRGRLLYLGVIIIICSFQAETISSVLHSSIIGIVILIIGACKNKNENILTHEH